MTNNGSEPLPKAILYSWPTSVWATVPRLCLYEKGYSEDEYVIKQVDISIGENFSPAYLKINMHGTIPTLVIPTLETTSSPTESRYRALRDTGTICDFLDEARTSSSVRTVSDLPAPMLTPSSVDGEELSDHLIALIHLPEVDPNFINMSARDPDELGAKASSYQGRVLTDRRRNLSIYYEEAMRMVSETKDDGEAAYARKMVDFLEDRIASNESLWAIYNGQVEEARTNEFYEISKKSWMYAIPNALSKLEEGLQGPYTFGEQVCLADLHIISWINRLIAVAGGEPNESGLSALQGQLDGWIIGPRVRSFWSAWTQRESFKRTLVPASKAFQATRGTSDGLLQLESQRQKARMHH